MSLFSEVMKPRTDMAMGVDLHVASTAVPATRQDREHTLALFLVLLAEEMPLCPSGPPSPRAVSVPSVSHRALIKDSNLGLQSQTAGAQVSSAPQTAAWCRVLTMTASVSLAMSPLTLWRLPGLREEILQESPCTCSGFVNKQI